MDRREQLFWKKVGPANEKGCRIWQNELDEKGYGRSTYKGYSTTAHRVAYMLAKGPIQPGLVVMHDCDNLACCNPDHLLVGTQKENLDDMRRKGRAGDCRNFGEKHGRCKLPSSAIPGIKQRYAEGDISQTALAKEHGISQNHLSRILRGVSRTQG